MRHRKKGRKLGTSPSHTKAIKKGLVAALLANDRIKTTMPRAKEIRGDVDRVITWAKRGDVHARRLAIAKVGDKEIVREVFEKVEQGMFADRNGGYTRIMRLGNRKGDNAPMVIMELVTESVANPTGAGEKAKKADKADKPLRGRAAEKAAEEELNAKFKFADEEADIVEEAAEEAAEAEEVVEEAAAEAEEAAEEAVAEAEEAAEAAEEATEEAAE